MKAIYGVANNNPFHVSSLIQQFKDSLPDDKKKRLVTQIFGFASHTVKQDATILLVPTIDLLNKRRKILDKAADALIFVFDNPVILEHYGVEIIDLQIKKNSYTYVYKALDYTTLVTAIKQGMKNKSISIPEHTNFDILPKLLNSVTGSITQNILTFIYSVKETDNRNQYIRRIVTWLMTPGTTVADIADEFSGVSTKALSTLVAFFNSEHGINTKRACEHLALAKSKKKPVSYKKIQEDFHVEPYDLKYLLRYYRVNEKYEKVSKDTKQIFEERRGVKATKVKTDKLDKDIADTLDVTLLEIDLS